MPNPVHWIVQAVAATAPGAWLVAGTLHHLDATLHRASGGKLTATAALAGLPVVFVTTRGARTGRERTMPLVGIQQRPADRHFALIGTNFGRRPIPGWYYNLRAWPRARVLVGSSTGEFVAHEASGTEYDQYWQCAVRRFGGYARYRARLNRRIPIMVLAPLWAEEA